MKKESTNEPAFASVAISGNDGYQQDGISKREYFAAMAMQGILSANPKETWENIDLPVPDYVAKLSIEFADAILEKL